MPASTADASTPRGQRTKDRIVVATASLLAELPAAAVSLDRIAREAEIAKSSVLWHFGGKERLFLAVVERSFAQFQGEFLGAGDGPLEIREVLPRFLRAYRAFLEHSPETNAILFRLLFSSEAGGEVRAAIAQMYRDFRASVVANTTDRGTPLSTSTASLLIAVVDGLFLQWFIDPEGFDLGGAFETLDRVSTEALSRGGAPE